MLTCGTNFLTDPAFEGHLQCFLPVHCSFLLLEALFGFSIEAEESPTVLLSLFQVTALCTMARKFNTFHPGANTDFQLSCLCILLYCPWGWHSRQSCCFFSSFQEDSSPPTKIVQVLLSPQVPTKQTLLLA